MIQKSSTLRYGCPFFFSTSVHLAKHLYQCCTYTSINNTAFMYPPFSILGLSAPLHIRIIDTWLEDWPCERTLTFCFRIYVQHLTKTNNFCFTSNKILLFLYRVITIKKLPFCNDFTKRYFWNKRKQTVRVMNVISKKHVKNISWRQCSTPNAVYKLIFQSEFCENGMLSLDSDS